MATGPDRPTMSAAHRAAVDEYLGTVRAVSEEFAEAFRSQTETLRTLTERLTGQPGEGTPEVTGDSVTTSGPRTPDGPRPRPAPGVSGLPDRPTPRSIPALFNTRDVT